MTTSRSSAHDLKPTPGSQSDRIGVFNNKTNVVSESAANEDGHEFTEIPKLYDEWQAAELLHVRPCTVRNERLRGKLGFVCIGRRIFYTLEQIKDYLEKQSVCTCVSVSQTEAPSRDKSVISGLVKSPVDKGPSMLGAERGTTRGTDKRAVSALAQQIFKRRASPSQIGWSKTTKKALKPDRTKS